MEHENNHNTEEQMQKERIRREEMQSRRQLRVSDILYAVRKHVKMIVLFTAVGMAMGIVLSVISFMRGEMSKQYAITSSIAVTSQNKNGLFTT